MRLANQLLLATLLLCTTVIARASDAPDWAKSAAQSPVPELKPHTPAVILLEDTTVTVDNKGRITTRTRIVYKILTAEGRAFATHETTYDDQSKITSLRAWTITAAGKVLEVKQSDARDDLYDRNFGEGFNDDRKVTISALLGDPGNIVAFEEEQQDRPYISWTELLLQHVIPVLSQHFSLKLPSDWGYNAFWTHHQPVAPENSGDNEHHWTFGSATAVDFEDQPLHPEWTAVVPRLILTFYGPQRPDQAGTWPKSGLWADGLIGDRIKPTPKITAKVAELTAGKTTFLDKVSAIGGFVQSNVRYYAIEIGIGGFQPHHAGEIFEKRYGDCKDKAVLTIAMLDAAGIRAHPLVVSTQRGLMDSTAPVMPQANHMITAIEVPPSVSDAALPGLVKLSSGERLLIFDPTDDFLPVGQIPSVLQGSNGLLVRGSQSQLISIPVLPPEQNVDRFSGHFVLDDHGALTGDLVETATGAPMEPWREVFKTRSQEEQRKIFEKYLTQYLAGPTLEKFSADNADGLNPELTVHASFKVQNYAKDASGMLLVRPRVVNSDYYRISGKAERLYPVEFESASDTTEDFVITLPKGYAVEDVPDPVNLDFGFATYSSHTDAKSDELHYKREFRLKQVELSSSQYGKLRDLMSQIESDENAPVMLKKVN